MPPAAQLERPPRRFQRSSHGRYLHPPACRPGAAGSSCGASGWTRSHPGRPPRPCDDRHDMIQLAVLDDYQQVAGRMVDWAAALPDVSPTFFSDHLVDEDALAARLAGFDAVVAMRERTPFPRSLLARLPRLRLLVTTGMRNAAIDLAAAAERGLTVCGTAGSRTSTGELTWGLILALARHVPAEDAAVRAGGWQRTVGLDLA